MSPAIATTTERVLLATPKPRTIYAPEGYGYRPGTATLVRKRSNSELVTLVLKRAFKRCGWPTHKVKVREFRPLGHPGDKPGLFYANIGIRRGLDPELVLQAVKKLPAQCGSRRVCAALDKIPERPEPS